MKIAPNEPGPARKNGRTEAVILFLVGNQMFAISASSVLEIRSTDSLSGSAIEVHQEKISKVHHRLRRGDNSRYVVNACEHFGLPPSRPTLVLILRGSRVAVLADRIERMDTISLLLTLPRPFRGPERTWYRGVTLIGNEVVPVVSSSGFLTEGELSYLDRISVSEESRETESVRAQKTPIVEGAGAVPQ